MRRISGIFVVFITALTLVFAAPTTADALYQCPAKKYTSCSSADRRLSSTAAGNTCNTCPTNSHAPANNTTVNCYCNAGYKNPSGIVGSGGSGGASNTSIITGSQACTLNSVTISYNMNGGTTSTTITTSCTPGTSCALESGATQAFGRMGYKLIGWSLTAGGTNMGFSGTFSANTTVYAVWQQCTAGTYHPATHSGVNANTCATCADGTTSDPGASSCVALYTCTSGQYLPANATACTTCAGGNYCLGGTFRRTSADQGLSPCPSATTYKRTTFPSNYYNPTIDTTTLQTGTGKSAITQCNVLTWMSSARGKLYEYTTYNTSTNKYDTTTSFGWSDVTAGYYLTTKRGCGAYAYYGENKQCEPGYFCPGKTRVACDSSNASTVHTDTFGRETCPTGYVNGAAGATAQSQCAISCAAGTQVATANATCTVLPTGWLKGSADTVNYGKITLPTTKVSCAKPYTTTGTTAAGHDNVNDCTATIPAGYSKPKTTGDVRYIRFKSSGNNINANTSLTEIQAFAASVGSGTNLLLNKALISGHSGSGTAAHATDGVVIGGSNANYVGCAAAGCVWDLGSVQTVGSIKFVMMAAEAAGRTYNNVTISVSSDNSTWIDVFGPVNVTVQSNATSGNELWRVYVPGQPVQCAKGTARAAQTLAHDATNSCPVCLNSTYADTVGRSSCAPCPSGYTISGTAATNHDAKSDCVASCAAGTRVATVDAACATTAIKGVNSSDGLRTATTTSWNWWTGAHTVTAGQISPVNYCGGGFTNTGTAATNHDAATDCTQSIPAGSSALANVQGRYVRIITYGNSANDGNHILEIAAFTSRDGSGTNLLSGKTGPVGSNLANATNGATASGEGNYAYCSSTNGCVWDIGSAQSIGSLKLAVYPNRTYYRVTVQVTTDAVTSTNVNSVNWVTVFGPQDVVVSPAGAALETIVVGAKTPCAGGTYRTGASTVTLGGTLACTACPIIRAPSQWLNDAVTVGSDIGSDALTDCWVRDQERWGTNGWYASNETGVTDWKLAKCFHNGTNDYTNCNKQYLACAVGYGLSSTSAGATYINSCAACGIGTYSTGDKTWPAQVSTDPSNGRLYGPTACTACTNKPANSHYTDTGVSTATCPWECDAGYHLDNGSCLPNNITITYNLNGGTGTGPAQKTDCLFNTPCALNSGATPNFGIKGYRFAGWALTNNATSGATTMTFTANTTVYAVWTACTGASYNPGPGNGVNANTCTPCPTPVGAQAGGTVNYWSSSGVRDSVYNCYARVPWTSVQTAGTVYGGTTNSTSNCYYYNGTGSSVQYGNIVGNNATHANAEGHGCDAPQTHSCAAGYYYTAGSRTSCLQVGLGYWSAADALTRTACTNLPANATYSSNIASSAACPFTCNTGYHLDNGACVLDTVPVTYNLNNGSGTAPAVTNCLIDADCTLASGDTTAFYRAGYVFAGWARTNNAVVGFSTINTDVAITVYAVWTPCANGTFKGGSGIRASAACTACSTLTGVNPGGGTYTTSPTTAATANTACRYMAPAKTLENCATVTAQIVSYSGTAWPATPYVITANPGATISGNNTSGASCPQCTSANWSAGGTATSCTNCPTQSNGWTRGTGTGWTGWASCYQTQNVGGNCTAGQLRQDAASASTWKTSTISIPLAADDGYYVSGQTCPACPAGSYCPGVAGSDGDYREACPTTGANGRTVTSPLNSDAATDCTAACPATISVTNSTNVTVVSANIAYSGTTYPVCTYNVVCAANYTAANNGSATPSCVQTAATCQAGQYLPANTLVCATCPGDSWCPGGTYPQSNADQGKTACDAGYTANTATGKSARTQCQIKCSATTYVSTANGACVSSGTGYWSAEHNVNYGSTSTSCTTAGCTTSNRNRCPTNYQDGAAATAQNRCVNSCDAATYVSTANGACVTVGTGYWSGTHDVNYGSTSTSCTTSSTTGCTDSNRNRCPTNYQVGAATTARNNCIGNFTLTGNQTTPANPPAGCATATYGTCSPGTCTQQKNYGGTITTDCTPTNCTKPVATVVASPNFWADSTTTCTACPTGWPNSAGGATARTQCYSNTKTRPWTGAKIDETRPDGCYSATYGDCSRPACEYVAYSNAAGTADGTIRGDGCATNNESCTRPITGVTADAGYYANGLECPSCAPTHPNSARGATAQRQCFANCVTTPIDNGDKVPQSPTVNYPTQCAFDIECDNGFQQYGPMCRTPQPNMVASQNYAVRRIFENTGITVPLPTDGYQHSDVLSRKRAFNIVDWLNLTDPGSTTTTHNAGKDNVVAMTSLIESIIDEYHNCYAEGYWKNGFKCETCPNGLICPAGTNEPATAESVVCTVGNYLPADARECAPCPAGSYCPNGAAYDVSSEDQGIRECPTAYPNSETGADNITDCYSATKSRPWTTNRVNPETPQNCASATFGTCSRPACNYVAYSNSSGDGDGNIRGDGCATNNEPCTNPVTSVVAETGYYANGTQCTQCPTGYRKGAATSQDTCYGDFENTGNAIAATLPERCASGTWGTCTPGVCTYERYYSGTNKTNCTPDNCTRPLTGVTAAAGSFRNGLACDSCSTAAPGYPNSAAGATAITQCYSNNISRPWTPDRVNAALPQNCASATYGNCTIGACNYTMYANANGDGAGELRDGCATNNEQCTNPVTAVVASTGYYANGTQCSQCPTGYRKGAATSQATCYGDFENTGTRTNAARPDNCASATYGTCTPGVCSYERYYSGTNKTNCTPTNCTNPVTSVTANTGRYVSGITCPACTNLPANAAYTGAGTTATNCPWSCNSGFMESGGQCTASYTITLNAGTCNQSCPQCLTSISVMPGDTLPNMPALPTGNGNRVFQGYFSATNGGGTRYYNANGTPVNAIWNGNSNQTWYAHCAK